MTDAGDRRRLEIINPFDGPGLWLTGCMHLHTSASDGIYTPEQTLRSYRELGYDFIAITDHESVTIPSEMPQGLIWIPGVEYATTSQNPPEHWHVVSIGTEKQLVVAGYPVKAIMKLLSEVSPFFFVAHPYWSNQGGDDLLELPDFSAIEVYNHMADVWLERGRAEYYWDYLLSAGRRVWGLAGDDTHRPEHIGGARLRVRVEAATSEEIMTSLKAGRFYFSSGPDFLDVKVDEAGVSVRTTPARSISFVADKGRGAFFEAEPDRTLTEAAYEYRGGEAYLRVQCTDTNGKRAWTNPVCFWSDSEQESEAK